MSDSKTCPAAKNTAAARKPPATLFASANGNATDNAKQALLDPTTAKPLQDLSGGVSIEETALLGIVVVVASLPIGLGFAIVAIGGALHSPDRPLRFLARRRAARRLLARRAADRQAAIGGWSWWTTLAR